MDGPEHYRAAERFAETATQVWTEEGDREAGALHLAAAQVHATLALAAATAMGLRSSLGGSPDPQVSGSLAGMWPSDFDAWGKVAGVPVDPPTPTPGG